METQTTTQETNKEKKKRVNTKTKRNLEFLRENNIWQRKSIAKVLRISLERAGYYLQVLKKEEAERVNKIIGGVEKVAGGKPAVVDVVPNQEKEEVILNG